MNYTLEARLAGNDWTIIAVGEFESLRQAITEAECLIHRFNIGPEDWRIRKGKPGDRESVHGCPCGGAAVYYPKPDVFMCKECGQTFTYDPDQATDGLV